jgi:LacI family transcriptional regulator
MAVTKKQIADYLGISRTAVSLVLNNVKNYSIKEETRQRILKAAAELGYNDKETDVVDKIYYILCNRELDNPRYVAALKSIEESINKFDYKIVYTSVKDDAEGLSSLHSFLSSSEIKGIILAGDVNDRIIHEVETTGIPFIVYMSRYREGINLVIPDVEGAAYNAVKYLADFGHDKILLFVSRLDIPIHQSFLTGYQKALADMNIPFNPSLVQINTEEDGYELVKRAELLNLEYTAILCANPFIQLGALMRLNEMNKIVPDDVSLLGYGYHEFMKACVPHLTSFTHDNNEIAEIILNLLYQVIHDKDKKSEQIHIRDCKLVKGGSVSKSRDSR